MINLLDAARQYHAWDANINAIQKGKKKPLNKWTHLHDQRQDLAELEGYPWSEAGGVGINNGAGGWHTYDIDAPKDERGVPTMVVSDATIDRLLAFLSLPLDYEWVWRSRSKAGWALAFHCDAPLPPGVLPAKKDEAGVAWGWPEKDSSADWHHLELRYMRCQTVYPPSAGYQWRREAPTEAPASVPIHRVISAFFAFCPPAPHTLGSIDTATKEAIKQRFDLVDYAVRQFGGDTQVEGDEIRVLGHGGLVINPAKQIWHCFGDEIGGDCFELVAYGTYRTAAKNLNGKGAEILQAAAEFAGVPLPDRTPVIGGDRAGDRQVIEPKITVPHFTIANEDALMDLPPIRYLDRDLGLVAKAFHLIYGASGSGKTFFAIERAMRQVALGRRVLYIATEDLGGLRYRVKAWRNAHPDASGNLTWLQMPEGLDLQDYNQVAELIDAVEPFEYDHIIIDTLRESHSGDENSSQDTRHINRAIQQLVVTGAAIDVIHHSGVAGERPRGSTALFGNADAVIKVEMDDGYVRIGFDKIRNAPLRDPLTFGIVQQDTGLADTDGEPVISAVLRPAAQTTQRSARLTPTQRSILEALSLSIFTDTGAQTKKLLEAATVPEGKTFYRSLSALKDRGYITQGEKGDPYYITPAGRAQLGSDFVPTVSSHTASASPTVTTVSQMSPTVTDSADTPTVLSVTVTTLRGDSNDSGVTEDKKTVTADERTAKIVGKF